MGDRPEWRIDIRMTSSPTGTLVRRITEHANHTNALTIPHGLYNGDAESEGTGRLIGTAAYWDGLWDRGAATDGTNAPFDAAVGRDYGAHLVLNGTTVAQTDGANLFKKWA